MKSKNLENSSEKATAEASPIELTAKSVAASPAETPAETSTPAPAESAPTESPAESPARATQSPPNQPQPTQPATEPQSISAVTPKPSSNTPEQSTNSTTTGSQSVPTPESTADAPATATEPQSDSVAKTASKNSHLQKILIWAGIIIATLAIILGLLCLILKLRSTGDADPVEDPMEDPAVVTIIEDSDDIDLDLGREGLEILGNGSLENFNNYVAFLQNIYTEQDNDTQAIADAVAATVVAGITDGTPEVLSGDNGNGEDNENGSNSGNGGDGENGEDSEDSDDSSKLSALVLLAEMWALYFEGEYFEALSIGETLNPENLSTQYRISYYGLISDLYDVLGYTEFSSDYLQKYFELRDATVNGGD